MKSDLKILKDILPVTIEEQELCWAASIEMVFKNQINQNELENILKRYIEQEGLKKFPKDLFYRLFNDSYLHSCGCTQIRLNNFLSPKFIKNQIKKLKEPIIFSNICYPISNKKHTFVVNGFKTHVIGDNEIFWILSLDPRNTSKTYKVAWVYDELIKFQKNKKNQLDFTTNIGKRNELIYPKNTQFSSEMQYSSPSKKVNYYWTSSILSTEKFLNYILKSKENLFTNFFNLATNDINHLKKISKSKLLQNNIRYKRMSDAFKESLHDLYFYPLMNASSNVVLLEFIYLKKFGKLKLIGIQESDLFTKILAIKQFQKGGIGYQLNHDIPNYEVIEYKKFKLLKILYDSDEIYTPIQDYGQLKIGNGYTINEINSSN